MKAIQFRIGNYFLPTDGSNKKFEEVTAADLFAWAERGAIYGNPIEITEYFLLKFGFKLEFDDKEGTKFYENDILSLSMKKGYNVSVFFKRNRVLGEKDSYMMNIDFVHQLQNLFYSLTLDELKVKNPTKA